MVVLLTLNLQYKFSVDVQMPLAPKWRPNQLEASAADYPIHRASKTKAEIFLQHGVIFCKRNSTKRQELLRGWGWEGGGVKSMGSRRPFALLPLPPPHCIKDSVPNPTKA